MTTFKILEQLVDDLPPEAWDMLPRLTQELVLERIYKSPKYNKNKRDA